MTDALTNAELVLRDAARGVALDSASFTHAADALVAERERRASNAVVGQHDVLADLVRHERFIHQHPEFFGDVDGESLPLGDSRVKLLDTMEVAVRQHIASTAAPPLPPATGEADYATEGDWERKAIALVEQQGKVSARLHYALHGECPAYPGTNEACDPLMCDCLSPAQELTLTELAEQVVAKLRDARPTPEPSEAMVEAEWALVEAATRAKECLMAYAARLPLEEDEAREVAHLLRSAIRPVLRAALAAQEGTP